MSEEIKTKYVSWFVFTWAISIIMLVIGWQFISISRVVDNVSDNSVNRFKIETQLSQIQTDLSWIKTTLSDHSKETK